MQKPTKLVKVQRTSIWIAQAHHTLPKEQSHLGRERQKTVIAGGWKNLSIPTSGHGRTSALMDSQQLWLPAHRLGSQQASEE